MLFDVPVDLQPVAEAQLLELEVLPAQLDLVGERRELAVVAHQHAEEVGHVVRAPSSARCGSLRTSDSTALMLLNRKCGRMRACSACSRASAIAGDSASRAAGSRRAARAIAASASSEVPQQRARAPRDELADISDVERDADDDGDRDDRARRRRGTAGARASGASA